MSVSLTTLCVRTGCPLPHRPQSNYCEHHRAPCGLTRLQISKLSNLELAAITESKECTPWQVLYADRQGSPWGNGRN